MGMPLGPHPGNTGAIEEFKRICDEKRCPKVKSWLYRIFGIKRTRHHEQWDAIYYEWRGQEMLIDMKFTGYS